MKQASITLRTDPQFKRDCDVLFEKMGITTVSAINMFLHQALMEQSIPFRVGVINDQLTRAVNSLPDAGYIDKDGFCVLPKEWDNKEDDVYDKYA